VTIVTRRQQEKFQHSLGARKRPLNFPKRPCPVCACLDETADQALGNDGSDGRDEAPAEKFQHPLGARVPGAINAPKSRRLVCRASIRHSDRGNSRCPAAPAPSIPGRCLVLTTSRGCPLLAAHGCACAKRLTSSIKIKGRSSIRTPPRACRTGLITKKSKRVAGKALSGSFSSLVHIQLLTPPRTFRFAFS
jgi:hypothetical protein